MFRLEHLAKAQFLIAAGLLAAPGFAEAQSYSFAQSSRSFSSIASTGTALSFTSTDDGSASFSAPFSFPFFGSAVSAGTLLYVNTNGTLNIGASFTGYSNTSIPVSGSPDGYFAPFWVDLRLGLGGVYYLSTGSELIVEWSGVESYSASGETISFQVRVATDGTVRYVYGPNTAFGSWTGASIGLEDITGAFGASAPCTPSCTPTTVPPGTEYVFTPGASQGGADLLISFAAPSTTNPAPGQTVSIDYEVVNAGAAAAGASRIALFVGQSAPVGTSDVELATLSIAGLQPGAADQGTLSFTVPGSIPAGTLAAALIVDPDDVVGEDVETNNSYALGNFTFNGGGSGISITTTELPPGTLGIPYNVQLQQVGGSAPTWYLLEGTLPSGTNLSSSGLLSGTPGETGTFRFTVEASEAGLESGFVDLTLVVSDGGSGSLTVTPTSLPEARVGVPYSAALSASGGVAPYAFQVISGRPDWLIMSSDGQITGTPNAAGSFSMTVSVFDSELVDGTAVVSLTVVESGPLEIVPSIPAAVAGRAYSQRVVRGGIPPYQVTLVDGALPGDMQIDTSGMLTGTPDQAGRWQLTLQVGDSEGGSAAGQVVLQATQLQELSIVTSEIVVALRNDVQVPLEASGGVPPYTWSVVQGSLQPGLALDPEGFVRGQVEQASTATVTFAVADADGTRAEREMLVVARGYRNTDPETMRSGRGGREGGCVCVGEPAPRGGAGLAALALLLGGGLARGAGRRRRHSRLGDGSAGGGARVTTPRGR